MPYGEMLMELSNQEYNNPYKYNGKEFDAATGYYYYGARYYDPKRSFWISVDPLAEITNSPYTYVWNNPVNYIDPTGMMGEKPGGKGRPDPNKIYDGGSIQEVIITRKRQRPGNSRAVQVYQYNVVRGANGWNVYRNSQLDRQITRVERKNWKGAEEQHFSVLKDGQWNNYESYADFSKAYPKHHLQGMPAKEIAKLSWSATKEVAKRTWESPETQPIILAVGGGLFEAAIEGYGIVNLIRSGGTYIQKGGSYSASEINAAKYMTSEGNQVILRDVVAGGAKGRTSDLLVNGISYDVYTPETSNISSIVRAIRNKNTQCNGVVLDLSKTSVKASDLGNLLKRVQGAGAKNIKDIVIMPK